MEQEIRSVKCLVTCDNMSIIRGDGCYLPLAKARVLQANGSVKIIDKINLSTQEEGDTDYLYREKYSKRRLTRVAWVQNYSKNGGAEISNFVAVRAGRRLGFDIVGVIIGSSNYSERLLDGADVVIVNNLHSAGKADLLGWLYKTKKPWIKYDHDRCESELEIYKRSRLNVFLSPDHKNHYVDLCGKEIEGRSICLPLAFDVDQLKLSTVGHQPGTVFVPCYGKCRISTASFIRENPQYSYFLAGDVRPANPSMAKITTLGNIGYSKIAEHYQKYEKVLHCPDDFTAGDRVLFEAVLCGCDVITSAKAGHSSWTFDWRDERVLRPILDRALYEFWREVEKVADNG